MNMTYVPVPRSEDSEEEKVKCPKCGHEFVPEDDITVGQMILGVSVILVGITVGILFIGFCVSHQNLSTFLQSTVGDFFTRLVH